MQSLKDRLLLAAFMLLVVFPIARVWSEDPTPHFPEDTTLSLGPNIPVAYVPPAAPFGESIFFGNGGRSLEHNQDLEGWYNLGVGYRALTNITTGSYNVMGGYEAGERITTNRWNTGWGEATQIYNRSGDGNTSLGWKAMLGDVNSAGPGDFNIAVGYGAGMRQTAGHRNIAVGTYAYGGGIATGSAANPTGSYNVIIGNAAGYDLTAGAKNILIGQNAGRGIANGNSNVIIGPVAGLPEDLSNTIIIADGAGNVRIKCEPSNCKFYASGGTLIGQFP